MTYENTSAAPPAETADRGPRGPRMSPAERRAAEGTVESVRANAEFYRRHGHANAAARADAIADRSQARLDQDGRGAL